MKYEMVCTKCLLSFPQEPLIEECPQCGRPTVKARKIRKNLLRFKDVEGGGFSKEMSEEWHKVRTKIYYAEYRHGKVGELVNCWAYNHILREGEIVVRRPNGKVEVADERWFFQDYEEMK